MSDLFSSLNSSMKKDRAAENADISREQTMADTWKAVGTDALGRYQNPTTTAQQNTELTGYSDTMNQKSTDFYKEAGMTGSANELASMKRWSTDVAGIKFDMLQTTKHESWAQALQSLGLSQESSRVIAMMHTQDREEKIAIYSGLMGAIGGLISKRSGGK
jgi:hypothetical protein